MAVVARPTAEAAPVFITLFDDINSYTFIVRPLLESDITFNTLCLSQLNELKPGTPGMVLGLIQCTSCPNHHSCTLICPGVKGIGSQLYVSASVCQHAADALAQQLPALPCTTISATAAGMSLILPKIKWRLKHGMNVMVYQPAAMHGHPETPSAEPQTRDMQQVQANTSTLGHSNSLLSSNSNMPSTSPALELRACSADSQSDVELTMQWVAEFLAEAFHMPQQPPAAQVEAMVLPRLQQGLFHVLTAAGQPVCMTGHVPTSSSSCRITMLFTPKELRGKGFGRQAVSQVCRQLTTQQQYCHICLMADQEQPAVNRLYQAVGFVTVGEMQMAERPVDEGCMS